MSEEAEIDEPKKGGGLMKPLLFGLPLVAAAAGAAFYFDVPGMIAGGEPAGEEVIVEAEAKEQVAIVNLDVFVVSLADSRDIRPALPRLNIGVAVMTVDPDTAEQLKPVLRNDFIAAMRVIDAAALRSTEGLPMIRSALESRAQDVLGDAYRGVLITEFIVL
ncbi:flagellar basal body-associated FliL family protein [Parvularcula lutaonensis]|uniref:Flagellar protein FliL n=1 Tax=Parvularcula lutaonensis TaxID=491923 RepID=A0ABV7MED7_9PROT|nr:flagellar basal body-associated FliL family protein [Parvularcula lutaonensis]GGY51590.1 hypothetical protein GCM10007148_20630 [Parvularcula lutaonensis]